MKLGLDPSHTVSGQYAVSQKLTSQNATSVAAIKTTAVAEIRLLRALKMESCKHLYAGFVCPRARIQQLDNTSGGGFIKYSIY